MPLTLPSVNNCPLTEARPNICNRLTRERDAGVNQPQDAKTARTCLERAVTRLYGSFAALLILTSLPPMHLRWRHKILNAVAAENPADRFTFRLYWGFSSI